MTGGGVGRSLRLRVMSTGYAGLSLRLRITEWLIHEAAQPGLSFATGPALSGMTPILLTLIWAESMELVNM